MLWKNCFVFYHRIRFRAFGVFNFPPLRLLWATPKIHSQILIYFNTTFRRCNGRQSTRRRMRKKKSEKSSSTSPRISLYFLIAFFLRLLFCLNFISHIHHTNVEVFDSIVSDYNSEQWWDERIVETCFKWNFCGIWSFARETLENSKRSDWCVGAVSGSPLFDSQRSHFAKR